jgi:hypothetical protein
MLRTKTLLSPALRQGHAQTVGKRENTKSATTATLSNRTLERASIRSGQVFEPVAVILRILRKPSRSTLLARLAVGRVVLK